MTSGKALNNFVKEDKDDDDGISVDESSGNSGSMSSCDGTSKHTDDEDQSQDEAKELRETVIRSEEKAVKRSRAIVGLAILSCAVAVTVAVVLLTKQSDKDNFELDYEGMVKDIRALVRWEVRYNFALMEQLSSVTTIAAGYLNSTFPFHTEPKFEISGGFVDGMGGIMSAAFAPLVREEQIDKWGEYVVKNQGWIEESAYLQKVHPVHRDALHGTIQDHEHDRRALQVDEEPPQVSPTIYRWVNGEKVTESRKPLYAPLWQVSPADYGAVNVNLLADPRIAELYEIMLQAQKGVLSSNFEVGDLFDFLFDPEEKIYKKDPHGFILQPVYDKISEKENATLVGFFVAIAPFGNLLDRLVPEGSSGVLAVVKDDCGNIMSFELSSSKTKFLGYEDLHDSKFDSYERIETNIEMYTDDDIKIDGLCKHDLYIYPTSALRDQYNTEKSAVYGTLVAIAFFVVILLFGLYDWMVRRRQDKTMQTALRSQAIVTSLFPAAVGKAMINEAHQDAQNGGKNKNLDDDDLEANTRTNTNAMAQLYPEATCMFADLVGFTSWSSMRDPPQVFQLLETLYSAFDKIAHRRRVFKVETIGDCYVAVCGLPTKNKKHHIVMARFAKDCLMAVAPILDKLERELGPDTADLGIRIGLNSGPITAGVLRADRARFQLFGDTVNTTARMETTGQKNKIHISSETATLLKADGKGHWLCEREDRVEAKGKGELQTWWLNVKEGGGNKSAISGDTGSSAGDDDRTEVDDASSESDDISKPVESPKKLEAETNTILEPREIRLVDWNTDVLLRLLKNMISQRRAAGTKVDSPAKMSAAERAIEKPDAIAFDELSNIISLPSYDSKAQSKSAELTAAEIDGVVKDQLRDFIMRIAALYRRNGFHNFEHASHVTMSVSKLLSRIVATDGDKYSSEALHDNTFGITSDPLTQFSVVISALIHDADHSGVPNAQLIKEKASIAAYYREKSVAEQNSIDLSWRLLMDDSYTELRKAIYCNEIELKRFRQLVVNTVLATDIADKELKQLRNDRWAKAFANGESFAEQPQSNEKEDVDRKATIVIEHIIQASDVSHTMQHWHIYRKWNERLFSEMHQAFKEGRADTDPTVFWYKGEIGFFDFYIIPLAKKLKECGVFGVSGDEYLNYALKNREEWERKGETVVAEYLEKYK